MKTLVPSDYIATALWHKETGSLPHYIAMMQNDACALNMPVDALYRTSGADWVCVSALLDDHPFRARLAAHIAKLNA